MILGEIMNFGAYAFVEAIVVVSFSWQTGLLPSGRDYFRADAIRLLISCCLCYHVKLVPG
jgi:hypothetical protein